MTKKRSEGPGKETLEQRVLAAIRKAGKAGMTPQQVALKLGLRAKDDRAAVHDVLHGLVRDGSVQSGKKGRFSSAVERNEAQGTIAIIASGAGFVRLDGDDGTNDVFVPQRYVDRALHGDRVRVRMSGRGRGRPEARVVDVVERKRGTYVGVVQQHHGRMIMVPDDHRIALTFLLGKEDTKGAKVGDKVVMELAEWRDARDAPRGKVITVLGKAGLHEVEMHAILAEFGLPLEFPDAVLADAERIHAEPVGNDDRRDMRDVTTLTIDPEDAKDLDDALSIRQLENGNWEVGIHIADVSHYVRAGSIIDQEALARGTSVYLVDRVVPMLPERLSNDLCSLNADTDKLTFSAVFELDENAVIKQEWFGRTVIRSNKRFAYADAQALIDGAPGPFEKEVLKLYGLSQKLRTARLRAGALEIISSEVRFKLDEKGAPIEVYEKVMGEANWLIEEFMLLANKQVAASVAKRKKGGAPPFVYRVHDLPDAEKVDQLRALARSFGHSLDTRKEEDLPHAINRLLAEVRGKEEEDILRQVVIRTMAKAIYTTDNIGHFGLAFEHYTHFTSPIRRYPDLMVHRAMAHYLSGGAPLDKGRLEKNCVHCSQMEKRASDAERASIRYKQAEYLKERIGETFDGTVSGITSWGVYVEIDANHCEGMIPLRDLRGDDFRFDEQRYRLIGSRTQKQIRLGDALRVTVRSVDMDRRQVALVQAEK